MDFDTMYKENVGMVRSCAMRHLRNREEAEDATQDTFVKAYQSFDSFNNDSSIGTWLVSICINHCHNLKRKRKREVDSIQVEDSDTLQYLDDLNKSAPSPEELLSADESMDDLVVRFELLPENIKTALKLRYGEQLAYKDIAEQMNVKINTARTWLHRGRTHLLDTLSP